MAQRSPNRALCCPDIQICFVPFHLLPVVVRRCFSKCPFLSTHTHTYTLFLALSLSLRTLPFPASPECFIDPTNGWRACHNAVFHFKSNNERKRRQHHTAQGPEGVCARQEASYSSSSSSRDRWLSGLGKGAHRVAGAGKTNVVHFYCYHGRCRRRRRRLRPLVLVYVYAEERTYTGPGT